MSAAEDRAVLDLAARHGIVLDPESLRFEEVGLDFRVGFGQATDGRDWVLRIPRRGDVVPRMRAEAKILAFVRGVLTAAVPHWQVVADELLAYPALPGDPGMTLDASGEPVWHYDLESPRFARSLGRLVAELHGADVDAAAGAGVPLQTPDQVRQEFADQLSSTLAEFDVGTQLADRWRRRLDDDGLWPHRTVLTHGELYPAHFLLDAEDRIVSVLDWTTAKVGDPAVDFSFQHMIASAETFGVMVDAYAESGLDVPARLGERCAEQMAASPVGYAVYALETGEPAHRAAAQALLLPS